MPKRNPKSGSFETSEFRHSFHQETSSLLRRRLIWFISIWGGLGVLGLVVMLIAMLGGSTASSVYSSMGVNSAVAVGIQLVWILCYVAVLLVVLEKNPSAARVIKFSIGLIILDGLTAIVMRAAYPQSMMALWYFVFSHFVACCVFPWTVRQAAVPIVIVVAASSFSHLVFEGTGIPGTIVLAIITVLCNTPALFISGFRHNQRLQRSTNKFLSQRYGMIRQELAYARQVHEALFPAPITTGPIHFVYRYEPMRQIGGDYLHAQIINTDTKGQETLSVVLVDVTGHGIPAALTVNRLHGEIDLRLAEQPDIDPGELLCRLNRYIHLTLSKHSIFATAICLKVVPHENKLLYASGGHPPSFIRGVDGTLRDLDPTTFVLGACAERDFDAGEVSIDFFPGDSLIAYTDGATEARAMDGKMLQIEGLRRIIAAAHEMSDDDESGLQGRWSERILKEVANHRGGLPPEDDTLAIEIYRPVKRASRTDQVHKDRKPAEHAAAE